MTEVLLSPAFLFRFAAPCRYRKTLWSARGLSLGEEYTLPSFGELEGKPLLADMRAAWSAAGLAQEIERLIRAFNPWHGTFTDLGEQRIRIHQASALKQGSDKGPGTVIARERDGVDVACGTGTLRITSAQLPGSKAQSINDLINGGKQVLLPGQELN